MFSTGEETEVRKYKRLTDLIVEDKAAVHLRNIQAGDCIVCFSKQHIYSVSQGLERLGIECAVIYGSLPPGPKLAMAEKFNNPDDPCKVSGGGKITENKCATVYFNPCRRLSLFRSW